MGLARVAMMAAALFAVAGEAAAQRRLVTEAERQAARAALESFTRPTLTLSAARRNSAFMSRR